jgi:hypothetical protein
VRPLKAWLVVVPLMVAGTEFAHALAYRLVYPQSSIRWRVLEATGHGYMAWAPVALGVAAALLVVGVGAGVVDAARGGARHSVSPWVFGLLPLLGYALQEFLERWVALGGLPWWMVEQPTFRVGMLLQLPFALAAFLITRWLLRVAEQVGIALRSPSRPLPSLAVRPLWSPFVSSPPRPSGLAAGYAGRGPPVLRSASSR